MSKEPNAKDKDKPKKYKGKDYWWCDNHKHYIWHKTSECCGVGVKPDPDNKPKSDHKPKGANKDQDDKPRLRVKQALETIDESNSK